MGKGKNLSMQERGVSRERLFELVWAEPMIKVAERFDVSSSYLARVCTTLNVPRPHRGYWAKLEVGKAPPKPTLPASRAGEKTSWVPGTTVDAPLIRSNVSAKSSDRNSDKDSLKAAGLHSLLVGVDELFRAGRESYRLKFLKPSKWNLPDIQVSRTGLSAALEFANAFFNALERRGHRVVLASNDLRMSKPEIDVRDVPSKQPLKEELWHPGRQTVAYFKDLPIGIAIYEVTEATLMRYAGDSSYVRESEVKAGKFGRKFDGNWTSMQDIPTGRLSFVAYSSYYSSRWSNQWKEKSPGKLIKQVVSLVKEIENAQSAVRAAHEKGKANFDQMMRENAEYTRRRAEEESARRKTAKIQESKAALLDFVATVESADRIDRAFQKIREMAVGLDKGMSEAFEAKLVIARQMLGSPPSIEAFLNWSPPDV